MSAIMKIFRMLIRQGKKPGATLEELLHSLGFTGKEMEIGRQLVYRYMDVLQRNILNPLCLRIRYIPKQKTFTITYKKPIGEEYLADLSRESFHTLKTLIALFQEFRDFVVIEDLVRARGLSVATVKKHLKELSSKGYVVLKGDKIYRSPKLIILIDYIQKGEE